MSQQDGKLDNVAKASTDATLKAAQNITPDLSELPNASDLPNPFDSTGFADKVIHLLNDLLKSLHLLSIGVSPCIVRSRVY